MDYNILQRIYASSSLFLIHLSPAKIYIEAIMHYMFVPHTYIDLVMYMYIHTS